MLRKLKSIVNFFINYLKTYTFTDKKIYAQIFHFTEILSEIKDSGKKTFNLFILEKKRFQILLLEI
jgi:hypothetical protein